MCRHKRLRSLLSGKRVNGSQQRYNGLTEERLCLIWCVLVGHLDLTWSLCFSVCEVDLWSRSKDQLLSAMFLGGWRKPEVPREKLTPRPMAGIQTIPALYNSCWKNSWWLCWRFYFFWLWLRLFDQSSKHCSSKMSDAFQPSRFISVFILYLDAKCRQLLQRRQSAVDHRGTLAGRWDQW